ncbi:MAG: MlaD family protein [candidate division WOR-3 bacterium]
MYKVKVGIFFILFLTLFIFGVFWIRDTFSLKKRYDYRASLKSASWLGNGDPVSVNGVVKGKVKFIQIFTDSVVVHFYLEDIKLREGAYARVENEGFIGGRRLSIYQGRGEFLPENALIKGEDTPTFTDFMFAVNSILQNVDSVSRKTSILLTNTNELVISAKDELRSISGDLRELASSLKNTVNNTDKRVEVIYYQLMQTANKVDETAEKLDSLVSSDGTVQKLLTDDSLYIELNTTVRQLKELVEDIRKNPTKYINLNVKIF